MQGQPFHESQVGDIMEILKEKTRGLCGECYREVDAYVGVDGDAVVIEKECPEHGGSRGILERDVDFFRKILKSNRKADPNPFPYRCLMINVTHACNLQCHLCYLPERNTALDLSLEEIKESISAYPGFTVALSGGEPTMRKELPELIAHITKEKKIPALVTNGVRLVDLDYLQSLKDAGLRLINFSFNGLKEEAFTGIENAPLLQTKLKALSNIQKVGGIYTQLSFTMAKGINDDQFGELIKFAMENNEFVYQIRARVATGIGRNIGEKDIYMSDFLHLLSRETGIPREVIVDYWTSNDWYPNPFIFSLDYFAFLTDPDVSKKLGYEGNPARLVPYLSKYIGEKNAMRLLKFKKDSETSAVEHPTFLFVLFSWPDRNTMDYEETKGLNLDILTRDRKVLGYWDGIIKNEKFGIL
jgi:7,8-dihydro-6-hydroxymethylpterin dimethyltransferase